MENRSECLIRSDVFEQATKIVGDTTDDMDFDIEQKDDEIEFLENQ